MSWSKLSCLRTCPSHLCFLHQMVFSRLLASLACTNTSSFVYSAHYPCVNKINKMLNTSNITASLWGQPFLKIDIVQRLKHRKHTFIANSTPVYSNHDWYRHNAAMSNWFPCGGNHKTRTTKGDAVALLAGQQTCDSQVAGSSPGWAPLCTGLGQATYTCVPLSPSTIIWYWPRGVTSLVGEK